MRGTIYLRETSTTSVERKFNIGEKQKSRLEDKQQQKDCSLLFNNLFTLPASMNGSERHHGE
jgi:hypothetical protein